MKSTEQSPKKTIKQRLAGGLARYRWRRKYKGLYFTVDDLRGKDVEEFLKYVNKRLEEDDEPV